MASSMNKKFSPDGRLILSPMLGPWDRYEPGSEQWAQAVAMHIQHDYRRLKDGGRVSYLLRTLQVAVSSDPPPWAVYPEEAKGNPDAWIQMVTGESWADVEAAVAPHDPQAWGPIADRLARWEAKRRTHGGDRSNVGATYVAPSWDATEARGIRRRLVKRADAGDSIAAELVEQLATGAVTVNQAAIAAGMRQRYFRVPLVEDVGKVAAAIARHLSHEQLHALVSQLSQQLETAANDTPPNC
jgi:hypothetical protein